MRHLLGTTLLAAVLGAIGPGVRLSSAQEAPAAQPTSPADLLLQQIDEQRRRIEALEAKVGELTTERRNIAGSLRQIEGMLANLRAELSTDDARAPLVLRAETPSDALASPESLMRELESRYRAEMAGMGFASEAERAAYAKKAQLWARLTNRELRGKRSWLVTLEDLASVGPRGQIARMTVLDAVTGLPIGEAVDVAFPAKFLERFNRGTRSGRWVLTSIVIARPVFNESRLTPGVFEFPPYVGPMMEFGFELDWYALSAWEPGQPIAPPEDAPAEAAEPGSDQPAEGA